ncbi:secondary thiamine-phosphate synthase enzyme YjbQ [bacterium]|nr:secondary thiamine-phosphate synthase enzyme YjbQ [bacterium]
MIETLTISTEGRFEFLDITDRIRAIVKKSGISEGICIVYSPHTTAGITINEHADPSVVSDIISLLDKNIPLRAGYAHLEGNSAAHIKTSLVGNSETIMIQNGNLLLGTWQGIFFCEFDGPRRRQVHVKIIKG